MSAPPLRGLGGQLVLAGAGKMGGALLEGWLAGGLPADSVTVIEPHPSDEIAAFIARGVELNPQTPSDQAAVVVLAVKPQMFRDAAPALRAHVGPQTLVLSIMAGVTLGALAEACGPLAVRAMPNTPASIGRGITVAVAAHGVSSAQRNIADALLRAAGVVEWVDDEALMDAVTAVSGSGPAYVFLLAEEMARAGVAAGLPDALATRLARETIAGAGELMRRSDASSATLRENVTSKGGTTAAALAVLMGEGGLHSLMAKAIAAATARSRELAS